MADLVIVANDVVPMAGSQQERGTSGGNINAGDVVYKSPDDHKWRRAKNNSTTKGAKVASGIALNSASAGQPVAVTKNGDVTVTNVLTAGTSYYLSSNDGKLCPRADVVAGMDVVFIGIAKSTTVLAVDFLVSGVTL